MMLYSRPLPLNVYQLEPAAAAGRQAENPLAALLAGIPDFNTEELKALLHNLPILDDSVMLIKLQS